MPSDVTPVGDAITHAEPGTRSRRGIKVAAVALLAGLATAFFGITGRETTFAQLKQKAIERSVPTVSVALPTKSNGQVTLKLPGRLEANARAALFARVSGFVASWKADIGASVKAGDILAEIEAPDLDQQLAQAQSDLVNAEAAAQLSSVTNQRIQALVANSTVSRQSGDEKASDVMVKRAQVKSAQANVARLQALAQYKHVVAPFDGTITARNTDVGALINAGSTTGSELFVISDTRRLRLYVNIPQNYVPSVKPGTPAQIIVPERPAKFYGARVESGSGAVDVASGTMRTQLVVDNLDHELIPGAYATVQMDITGSTQSFSVPASAVIFDKSGLRVATVDNAETIVFKAVSIARDLGSVVELASGITATDRIVQSPPDDLREGDHVKVLGEPAKLEPASAHLQKRSEKG